MNYLELLAFVFFCCSVFVSGVRLLTWLGIRDALHENKSILIGELLLCGSVVLVSEFLILSLTHLYEAVYLWGCTFSHFLFLFSKQVRGEIKKILIPQHPPKIPTLIWAAFILIFIFRNCYFMTDVDSHGVYLFTQKLWLFYKTSIFSSKTIAAQVFVPHFDAVPFSLGISIFEHGLLFCQMINLFWRLISLVLIFGYVSYRFGSWYGLAAALFVLFDEHFFYSGANRWVLINGALIAFLFASVYSFWEASRIKMNNPRFLLGLFFLMQLMSNKYQMAYAFIALLVFGMCMQNDLKNKLSNLFTSTKSVIFIGLSTFSSSLWYLKNYFATRDPTFPIFAGKLHVLGWDLEKEHVTMQVFRGLNISECFKYLSYLFVWPGITSSKIVYLAILSFPFIFLFGMRQKKVVSEMSHEVAYWLMMSLLVLVSICIASHQDPRYYRFGIAIFSVTSVLFLKWVFQLIARERFRIPKIMCMMLLCFLNVGIVWSQGGSFVRPQLTDNLAVLKNQMRIGDILGRYFPEHRSVVQALKVNESKLRETVLNLDGTLDKISVYLMPLMRQLSVWSTSAVKWHSYVDANQVLADLNNENIKWVVDVRNEKECFISAEEYAKQAVLFNRYPEKIHYPYDMPPELIRTKFKSR